MDNLDGVFSMITRSCVGYDSVRLRQAWETWQRLIDGAGTGGGGSDDTDAAVGKAVAAAEKEKRLKALLARSQVIAQRLREVDLSYSNVT